MSKEVNLIAVQESSYRILKWVGGGGFGQVFKVLRNNVVLACKQIQTNDPDFALQEQRHMTLVRGGPHIAAVHDEVEWNSTTKTLSFFMDYYKGKDLDRQVETIRAAGQAFTENQIIEIGYQIAVALEYCHRKKLLHQDMKPMNVLLRDPWDPISEGTVPDLYVTDFGIASHVRTIGTRMTGQRGTLGYEAPEISGPAALVPFSQKSDVYAFGCILFRLCTLKHPFEAAGLQPREISRAYSIDLLSLISTMLSIERVDRPTAAQVKEQLMALIRQNISPTAKECRKCQRVFLSTDKLRIHLKRTKHSRKADADSSDEDTFESWNPGAAFSRAVAPTHSEPEFRIKGMAKLMEQHQEQGQELTEAGPDPCPCVVCMQCFDSKKTFFKHLHNRNHYRSAKYVLKRKSTKDLNTHASKRQIF
ncbi:kinase-like domain-containing protein [Clohesyomyces aquaticus]|uniref:non-specific serine/threonine protein kinase n=1 Tax=Clohesyomyces aquaticus TaxID=1231657 RepID=A0A1Y1ZFH1_9PLEO|nr:kinase-like domain-containing protein [Clohesyomyces aquaticus]